MVPCRKVTESLKKIINLDQRRQIHKSSERYSYEMFKKNSETNCSQQEIRLRPAEVCFLIQSMVVVGKK